MGHMQNSWRWHKVRVERSGSIKHFLNWRKNTEFGQRKGRRRAKELR